jgi:aspartate ammonia-lyase
MTPSTYRREKDLIGERDVPVDAYFGIHTLRAVENFAITGIPIARHPALIRALAKVKRAAAQANADLGLLDRRKAEAIVAACEEIRSGRLHDQFPVDVIQGGAGTSTNMNVNEVIANRALEFLGHRRGKYEFLHPLDDVNLSQSTNDVYPTAVRIALHELIAELNEALGTVRKSFEAKAVEFGDAITIGRTQLQWALVQLSSVLKRLALKHAFEVIGNDVTISFAADNGQLLLNAFAPIMAHRLFEGIGHLREALLTLAYRCIRGITADRERVRRNVEQSIGLATALTSHVGYGRATQLAREALASDRGVYELGREKGWLTREQLNESLSHQLLDGQFDPQPGICHGRATDHHEVRTATQRGVQCPTI